MSQLDVLLLYVEPHVEYNFGSQPTASKDYCRFFFIRLPFWYFYYA